QARDQVAVANQALAQAREAFDLARTRYNAGVATRAGLSPLLEVSDAQAALTLAETNQVNALYDYNQSRGQLDRAIGRYSFVPNGPGFVSVPSAKTLGKQ
ncbi:MAG TPA: TolC family protein, partial [Chthonomonadaceae bacterium]|nr:TolC family protein [Chthonomonadaceae bacterium]